MAPKIPCPNSQKRAKTFGLLDYYNSGFALAVRLSTGPRRETVVQRALKKEISFNFMKEIPLKKIDKYIEIAFKFT